MTERNAAASRGHLSTGYSHLFPGIIVTADSLADAYELEFSDGSMADAAILRDPDGRGVLEVDAYTTAAGTSVSERVWTISSIVEGANGHQIMLGAKAH
ncbi:hypothetical protein AB0H76_19830 [Nocardia sp. NPDC050712]|uniref:hypothetical protein n=1 Tax=Nocardia sp. NPDC050712 TaxID=3155518 RepID=UPI0033D8D071